MILNCLIPILTLYMLLLFDSVKTFMSQTSCMSYLTVPHNKYSSSFKCEQSTEAGQKSSQDLDNSSKTLKALNLMERISKVEKAQNQMEIKFQRCIESLIQQIQKRQLLNNKLLKQVSNIKESLDQSSQDIEAISIHLKKNKKLNHNMKSPQFLGNIQRNKIFKRSRKVSKKSIQIKYERSN